MLVTMGIALMVGLLVTIPGLIALSTQQWDLGARTAGHGAQLGRHRALLAAQMALSVVLAFGAALFATDLFSLGQLPLGFNPSNLHWARLDRTSRTDAVPTIGYADTLLARLAALPGIDGAAMSTSFGTADLWDVADGITVLSGGLVAFRGRATTDRVSPDFFRTASIPLDQGREFTWNDVSSRARVAILNRSLADRLRSTGIAVGRTVHVDGRGEVTIVGVVADATPGDPRLQDVPQLYLPLGPDVPAAPVLLVRNRIGSLTEASLRAIGEPLGRHHVLRVRSMEGQLDSFLVQERVITTTATLFAVLAVIVCLAGLYAAMTQNVIRRTREIGVRIAVGASPAALRTLVLAEAGRIVLIGVGLGVPAAVAVLPLASALVSDPRPNVAVVLSVTAVAIVVVAMLVAVSPARRAAQTPVADALRAE
jgi:hypothetical protein